VVGVVVVFLSLAENESVDVGFLNTVTPVVESVFNMSGPSNHYQ